MKDTEYCQIDAKQFKISQKTEISADISARLFRVTCNKVSKSLKYATTQKLNCRCQKWEPKHFTVSLMPTWWILLHLVSFTPPGEFYSHS